MEKENNLQGFTRYEIARIIGARALQITMDAPILLKISDEKLKSIFYDPLKIAEMELGEDVLPISISRPVPRKKKDKLQSIKEEKISDEDLLAKEQEVEKEIVEDAAELGLVEKEEDVEELDSSNEEH